jgi:hypothetical protein
MAEKNICGSPREESGEGGGGSDLLHTHVYIYIPKVAFLSFKENNITALRATKFQPSTQIPEPGTKALDIRSGFLVCFVCLSKSKRGILASSECIASLK